MLTLFDTRATRREEVLHRLARPPLEEMEESPRARQKTRELFGEELSAAEAVQRIVAAVREGGDRALLDLARRLDGFAGGPEDLFVSGEELARARDQVSPEALAAIRTAAANIEAYHRRQLRTDWLAPGPAGSLLGQRYLPVERVAVLVPGAQAPLVSSALMALIPARVAGVPHVVMATAAGPGGRVDPHLLAAALEGGAHRVLRIGGAHTVAALAYGTETVAPVDKIVGPGGLHVQLAKKEVFGRVGIDGLAGPSEICVLADETARPDFAAADLLSQAEHTDGAAWLVTPSAGLARAVSAELTAQLAHLPRGEETAANLKRWGAAIVCRDLAEGAELVNGLAPEHLELLVADPWALLPRIRQAGAVFLGPYSTEPIGDYVAGSNHILPTNRSVRFGSQLGVEDFLRRTSVLAFPPEAAATVGPAAVRLAAIEGLPAHGAAVERRLSEQKGEKPRWSG